MVGTRQCFIQTPVFLGKTVIYSRQQGALREAPLREDGTRSLLAKAVGYLKMNSSKRIHEIKPEMQVWQRSYHVHVIRGEADYRQIWEYIETNPAKGAEDRYYGE